MDRNSVERELMALRRAAFGFQSDLEQLQSRIAALEVELRKEGALKAELEAAPPIPVVPVQETQSVEIPEVLKEEIAEPEPIVEEVQSPSSVPEHATVAPTNVVDFLKNYEENRRRQLAPEAAKVDSAGPAESFTRVREQAVAAFAKLVSPSSESTAKQESARRLDLELRIGGVWFNRIGAIILLLAAAFLVKISIDRGWINETARVLLAAAFGVALIGIGEYFLFRKMRSFSAGLLGCGVGVLYLSAFGAHKYYGLIEHSTASILYTVITVIGAGVAVHANMLPVAILAVIGGYGTPLLLSTGRDQQVALLIYVLAMNVGFLFTAWFRRWDVLRPLVWVGTLALFGGWYAQFYSPTAMWRTAGFVFTFYLLFHGDFIVSQRQKRIEVPRLTGFMLHANNVVFFAGIYFLLHKAVPQWMGLFAVATAAVQWICAWKVLDAVEEAEPARRSLWLDGAAMLALAAPLQFDRYMVSISWSVQAVVTLWFCRRHAEIWLRVKSMAILAGAVGHLLIYEINDAKLAAELFAFGEFTLNWVILCFMLVGLCAYACTAVLAVRRTPSAEDQPIVVSCVVLGTFLLLGIFAHQWERYAATWAWVSIAVLWWFVARRASQASLVATALAFLTVGKFLLVDTLAGAADGAWSHLHGIVFNRAVLCGLVIVGLLILLKTRSLNHLSAKVKEYWGVEWAAAINVAVVLVISWTATFEVLRVFRFEEYVRSSFQSPHLANGIFLTLTWTIIATTLWIISRPNRKELAVSAAVLTTLSVVRLTFADTFVFAQSNHWRDLAGICINRTFLVGLAVVGCILIAYMTARKLAEADEQEIRWRTLSRTAMVVAAALVTWLATFEVLRSFRFEASIRSLFERPDLAVGVMVTATWSINAIALWFIARRKHVELAIYALILTFLAAAKLVSVDTLFAAANGAWSDLTGIATNRTFIVGTGSIACVLIAYWSTKRWIKSESKFVNWPTVASSLIVSCAILATWVPTFEIVRVFRFEPWGTSFKDSNLAMHVAISCYWSFAAISMLIIGFARNISVTRYAGIGLFTMTIGKVFLVDMSRLDMVYRVISFMVVGLLLILASFLYQRLRAETTASSPTTSG